MIRKSVFNTLLRTLKAILTSLFLGGVLLLSGCQFSGGVLDPKGFVAHQERTLMMDSIAMMLIVVIPVIIMSFAFAFRYRKTHDNKSKYRPEWAHNTLLEAVWWGVPLVIIVVLGIWTWVYSHSLDPYRPLDENVAGTKKPLVIDAIALRWKWLFLYPEQGIATVNDVHFPVDRAVRFRITSDAPMSAFFIPQLGSQIYAMAGMETQLNLKADVVGKFIGMDTQYNGDGFSDMKFWTHVTTEKDFASWVSSAKQQQHTLTDAFYKKLWCPSMNTDKASYNPVIFSAYQSSDLFDKIKAQFKGGPSMHSSTAECKQYLSEK